MVNHAEILLSTVQHLRRFLSKNPRARSDIATIECSWLPGELFPPERRVVLQALNVLINAGELIATGQGEHTVFSAKEPLEQVAGY